MGGFSETLGGFLGRGRSDSHLDFNDEFGTSLGPFLSAARSAGHNISINSGARSPEAQASILAGNMHKFGFSASDRQQWESDVTQYGAIEAGSRWANRFTNARRTSDGSPMRNWIALPGSSNHQHGGAADLAYSSPEARAWAHDNAATFGLDFRLGNEPWHIELARRAEEDGHGHHAMVAAANTPSAAEADVESVSEETNTAAAYNLSSAMLAQATGQPTVSAPPAPDGAEAPSDQNLQVAYTNGVRSNTDESDRMNEDVAKDEESASDDTPTYKMRYADTTIKQALDNQSNTQLASMARNYMGTMTPEQRMLESAMYAKAKRHAGESLSMEQFFIEKRFPQLLSQFASNPRDGSLTANQNTLLTNALTQLSAQPSYAQAMGLA